MNFQFSAEKNVMGYKQKLLDEHSSSECWIKLKESEINNKEAQNQISLLNEQLKKQEADLNDKSKFYLVFTSPSKNCFLYYAYKIWE